MRDDPARVRSYQPRDLDDLYRICLLTADNGQDATRIFDDPKLPGNVYAAPYAILEPASAFVAEDANGVGGYIVGALDTLALEQRLEQVWWPKLRARYPQPPADQCQDMPLPQQRALQNIHHPWRTAPELAKHYPSHLHINLEPQMQGRGLGRQLIASLVRSLRSHGSHGLHLMVGPRNTRAVDFYRHVGFSELPVPDVHAFGMDFDNLPAWLE